MSICERQRKRGRRETGKWKGRREERQAVDGGERLGGSEKGGGM